MHLSWSAAEVDEKLHAIMHGIHAQCVKYGTEPDGYINYVKGANIAGFMKVAHAMMGKAVVTIIIACTALYAWNHKQPVLTNVQLQNLEAIAAGEEGACIRWIEQTCYYSFSEEHDNEPHYECNGSSGQAGMTSCGVINNKKPTFGYVKGTCLICIEH